MSYWFKDNFKDTVTLYQFLKEKIWMIQPYNIFTSQNPTFASLIADIWIALDGGESVTSHTPVDYFLSEHYGDLEINPKYGYITSSDDIYLDSNEMTYVLDSIFAENLYKYQTLLNTLSLEYNPIWNVDSEETATESRDERNETNTEGPETKQTTLGSQENEYSYGSAVEKTHTPEYTNTQVNGSVTTTNGIENGHIKVERTTNFNTQMNDTADWYNHDRSEKETQPYEEYSTKGSQSNSETIGEHTLTLTKVAHTDDETIGAKTDAESKSGRTDTVHKDAYEDETHIIRQGNIGTTTTQQMITEERELAKFSLLDVIAKDFVKALCISVYY